MEFLYLTPSLLESHLKQIWCMDHMQVEIIMASPLKKYNNNKSCWTCSEQGEKNQSSALLQCKYKTERKTSQKKQACNIPTYYHSSTLNQPAGQPDGKINRLEVTRIYLFWLSVCRCGVPLNVGHKSLEHEKEAGECRRVGGGSRILQYSEMATNPKCFRLVKTGPPLMCL